MLFIFFVILVDDDYCVAIHDLSPVLTALFSIELGGFNKLCLMRDDYTVFNNCAITKEDLFF